MVTRVGHSFIKATMAETGAVFGGSTGHFCFRDFWRADGGMLAALHVLSSLSANPPGTRLSQTLEPFSRYVLSGEINTGSPIRPRRHRPFGSTSRAARSPSRTLTDSPWMAARGG